MIEAMLLSQPALKIVQEIEVDVSCVYCMLHKHGNVEMDQTLKNRILQLKYELGSLIGQYPTYYEMWCRLFSRDALNLFVSDDTDIVIEGFPRSGNTFAIAAFIIAQNYNAKIAHHTHKVMQVVRAIELNVPTLVLIRRPADAVVSLTIRHPYISLQQGLRIYIRYYKGILPYRQGYTMAKFEDVTLDYGQIIRRVNRQFSTDFALFQHNPENEGKAFRLVEEMHFDYTGSSTVNERTIARPSIERHELNATLQSQLETGMLKVLLEEATAVYEEIIYS